MAQGVRGGWQLALCGVVGDQLDDSFADFGDHPGRCHRHHPAGLGTACLQAIEVRLRPVAMLVVLDAELGDLSVDGGCDLLLRPLDLGAPLRRRAVLAVQVIVTGFSGLRLLRQSQQHMTEEFIDVYGNYAIKLLRLQNDLAIGVEDRRPQNA